MDVSEIVAFLSSIPVWGWVVGFFVLMFIMGDRILWDYEVKFPLKEGVGRGKVELEGKKKKGPCIECRFELEERYRNKDIVIFLNGTQIYKVPAEKNNAGRIYFTEPAQFTRPKEGDTVIVSIGGEEVFSGQLVLD